MHPVRPIGKLACPTLANVIIKARRRAAEATQDAKVDPEKNVDLARAPSTNQLGDVQRC